MIEIEQIVDDMHIAYLKEETYDNNIKFNIEELNLIKQYKHNLKIYFLIPDMNPLQKDDFAHAHALSFVAFDREQESYMRLCRSGGILYRQIRYSNKFVTTKKISESNNSAFLIDTIGNNIVWGWNHIIDYTNLIWSKAYQKYVIIPKMQEYNSQTPKLEVRI